TIHQRLTELRRANSNFVSWLILPVTSSETQLAGPKVMQMTVTRLTMLRKLEVMVLHVGQRVTHVLLTRPQNAAVVNRFSVTMDRASQFDIRKIFGYLQRRPDRTRTKFRRGEVKIVDLLGRMIRPFVPQNKPKPPWTTARIDQVAANYFGL